MKKVKALIGVAGVAMMTAVLAGCAQEKPAKLTKKDLFIDAINEIKKNNSFSINAEMDIGVKTKSSDLSFDVDASGTAKIDTDIKNNIMYSGLDVNISAFGMSQPIKTESYLVRDGEQFISYTAQTTNDDTQKQWSYSVKDSNAFSFVEFIDKIDVKDEEFKNKLDDALTDMSLSDELQKTDDKYCYVVNGIIQIDGETFSKLSSDYTASLENEKLDIKSVWYFERKGHLLKRVELDLASSLKSINTGVYDIKFEPDKFNVMFDFSYDKKLDVTIPEEVKENAKESVDSLNAIELMTRM